MARFEDSNIFDSDGAAINVQNPLQVDGVSVHASDIWVEESEMNGFSGVITDLFDNLHSVITDATATDPKHVLIHFQRTTVISSISLGAYTGDFSNLLVKIVTSGGIEIPIIDESADDTKYTSRSIELPILGFNAMRVEFHTEDQVSLSNLFMPKVMATTSRIQGQQADGDFSFVSLTNGANMKTSLEELESDISSNSNSQLNVTPFHADGTEGALITGIDYVAGKSGIDASTEVLEVINYEHHEIHSGSHYFISDYASFANGAVMDFTITTPDTTKEAHFLFGVTGTAAVSVEALAGAVVDTPGTVIASINNNGNSSNTSDMVVRTGDTFTSEGVSKLRSYAGANKVAGVIDRAKELVLARNTVYIMRITNETATANIINWNPEWYEHTPKN